MRYFCGRCSAESEEQLSFCLACGRLSVYVPQIYIHPRSPGAVRYRTARQLAYGKAKTQSLFGLGVVPCEPLLISVYGPPGGGKSTWMLRLARDLADRQSPSIYVSAEEGFAESVAARLRLVELCEDDVYFVEPCHAVSAIDFAETHHSSWIFLDSYSVSSWSLPDLVAVKRSGISCVYSLHVTKAGDVSGEMAVAHEADLIVRIEDKRWAHEKNRFGGLLSGDIGVATDVATNL